MSWLSKLLRHYRQQPLPTAAHAATAENPVSRRPLFEGEIGRLLILAAPSGAGKSTLLNNPSNRLGDTPVPEEISDLSLLAPNHKNIMKLHRENVARFDSLCLHVDITHPIRMLRPAPGSRESLLAAITPQRFSDWNELIQYSERAAETHVITLFVRREEHFRRWSDRELNERLNRKCLTTVAAINGDSTNSSELHRKVYSAWQAFIKSMAPESAHILDGNQPNYFFLSQAEYDREIATGYKSTDPPICWTARGSDRLRTSVSMRSAG